LKAKRRPRKGGEETFGMVIKPNFVAQTVNLAKKIPWKEEGETLKGQRRKFGKRKKGANFNSRNPKGLYQGRGGLSPGRAELGGELSNLEKKTTKKKKRDRLNSEKNFNNDTTCKTEKGEAWSGKKSGLVTGPRGGGPY